MGIIDYHQLPSLDLFGILTFHFACTTWALVGFGLTKSDWMGFGLSYMFYNTIFLIVLVWCIKDTLNEIPLILAIRVNVMSIIFDVCVLIFFSFSTHILAVFGCIAHLVLRFLTIPILSKMCSDKTGGLNDGLPPALTPIFGVDPANGARDPYENIDNGPHHQSYPKSEPNIASSQSYNFTSNIPTYQA